jgi:hypothetical protein
MLAIASLASCYATAEAGASLETAKRRVIAILEKIAGRSCY